MEGGTGTIYMRQGMQSAHLPILRIRRAGTDMIDKYKLYIASSFTAEPEKEDTSLHICISSVHGSANGYFLQTIMLSSMPFLQLYN